MNNYSEIIKFVLEKGWIAVIIIVLVLIIHNPDRAEKLKEIIFLPIFRFLKRGQRQYIAAKINYTCSEFFKKNVNALLTSSPSIKIRIKWVNTDPNAIMKQDGILVLCLRDTNDQTRNILAATQIALPQIVCPTLRPRIAREAAAAIDLVFLKRLADGLGKYAKPIFQRYFLEPALEETPDIQTLFQRLIELDQSGMFVTIFLEELNVLGEISYSIGDLSDKTEAFHGLLSYLLEEAKRKVHEEILLEYFSADFRIGIILLAIKMKARTLDLTPYLARLDQKIKLGCDSIYVIAYQHAFDFLSRFLNVAEGDERVSLAKNTIIRSGEKTLYPGELKRIVLLRMNPLFSDTTFEDKVRSVGIAEGATVDGVVLDVTPDVGFVDVRGMNATIHRAECSWDKVFDCTDMLAKDDKKKFLVKLLDPARSTLILSLRLPNNDPWKAQKIPSLGETIEIEITKCTKEFYLGYHGALEFLLPKEEVSWTALPSPEEESLLNTKQKVVIIEKNDERHELKGSIRRLRSDPWPEIQKNLPKGTVLRGTVMEATSNFVRVRLPGGLEGIIPREAMQKAGFEYADYQTTLTKGQGLDVVVTHVFINRKKIRLDLRRNIEKDDLSE